MSTIVPKQVNSRFCPFVPDVFRSRTISRHFYSPTADDLRGFLLGSLPEEKAALIADWLSTDPDAIAKLREISAADTLTAALSTLTGLPEPLPAHVEKVIQTIIQTLGTDGAVQEYVPSDMPKSLGGFRIVKELGRGGMGIVYEANDDRLARKIALKVMRGNAAANPEARLRFLREARSAASLSHDHIVAIHHVGEQDGVPFITMPLLKGESLEARLANGTPLPVAEAVRIAREMAQGLAAAHEIGLIHRDIKPANIWLEAPAARVKLLDFGLARTADDAQRMTHSGAILGTPNYMAPEQAGGEPPDARADLFSLGVVLYEMTTGKRPFVGKHSLAVLNSLANHQPLAPKELNPVVPAALSELTMRLLAKDPAQRLQNAEEAIAAFRHIERQHTAHDQQPLPSEPLPPQPVLEEPASSHRARRRGLLIGAALFSIAALVVAAVIIIRDENGKEVARLDLPKDSKIEIADEGNKPEMKADPQWSGQSPLDNLDPKKIPPEEKFDWQPPELVAVIGEHRQRFASSSNTNVRWIAASPDGKQIGVCGWDCAGRFDIRRPPIKFVSSVDFGSFVVFHPDGNHLIAERGVFDIAEKLKKIAAIPFVGTFIPAADLTKDGRWLFAWEHDLAIFDCQNLMEIRRVAKLPDVRGATISPDGKRIAAYGNDFKIRIYDWDGAEAKLRFHFADKQPELPRLHYLNNMLFSPDGRLGVYHADEICRLWDIAGNEPKSTAQTSEKVPGGGRIAFSPDGTKLIVQSGLSGLSIWKIDRNIVRKHVGFDSTGGESPASERLDASNLHAFVFLDNDTVATADLDKSIRFWDTSKDPVREINPIKANYTKRFAFGRDGKRMIAIAENNKIRSVDLTEANPKTSYLLLDDDVPGHFNGETGISARGEMLFIDGEYLSLTDSASKWSRILTGSIWSVSRDGRTALVGIQETPRTNSLSVWDIGTKKPKQLADLVKFNRESFPRHLLSSHHVLWQEGNALCLYAITDGKLKKTDEIVLPPNGEIVASDASDDNRTIAFAQADGSIYLREIRDGKIEDVAKVPYGGGGIGSCSLSPNGKQVAVTGGEGGSEFVRVIDIATKNILDEWQFPVGAKRVLFAPDGRHLAVLGANGVIYIMRRGVE